ncbi:MAG: Rpn family recombination-promoting nuclease/putative transposase [Sulfurimonas sp.]|nr:Rpn family recombination-promoting nuclease/putative transposase [Sulfurimonas sp.]
MNFLDVKMDYAFKKVFGSEKSKRILISFLNALVYDNKKIKIKDLTIVDPYNIPMIKGVKDTFVDVKAVLDDDTKVIIEMQVLNHKGFEKRVLYNAAKNYSIQLSKNDDYHLLNPVIALSIVDFNMFEDSSEVITNFKLLEKNQLLNYNDDIELIFVELPKFTKELDTLENIKEQWIYFVKNAGSLEYIPNSLDEDIKEALNSVNEASMTKDELEVQHKRKEFISIQKLAILKADEDGFERGVERGIEKGIEQEKINIAKNLLDVLDNKTISLKTGLDEFFIESLRVKHTL